MKYRELLPVIFLTLASVCYGNGKVQIVTTIPDLSAIAQEIGQDKVNTFAIAKGYQDPHFVDAKPSFVLKLKQAELFVQVGLDLEVGWVPPLLQTARNRDASFGGKGYLDASGNIDLLEVPSGDAAELRAGGDIHIYGNPHYWLDPRNGKIVAKNICDALTRLKPGDAAIFDQRLQVFEQRVDSAYAAWQEKLAPYRGSKMIAYHNSWPYFEKAFGLEVAGFIEPKPGIPPTPSHLVSVIKLMRKENIKVIIISPYFDDKPAQSVANRTGAIVVPIAPSVGARKDIKTYFDLFDYNVNRLVEAFRGKND